MTRNLIEYTPEAFAKAEYKCHQAFQLYQHASDRLETLKEHGKDLLAVIMTSLDRGDSRISEAKLERMARGSTKWQEYRMEWVEAVQDHGEKRVAYYSYVRIWETIQSGLSFKKVELGKL